MTGQTVSLDSPLQRKVAHSLVDAAPVGAQVKITPPTRSTDQNAKMWAMLGDVSRSKPEGRSHTPDVWKALFMHALGYETRFLTGLNGEPFPAGFRSSRLSVREMSDLIEFMHAWGSERGVMWTDPEAA